MTRPGRVPDAPARQPDAVEKTPDANPAARGGLAIFESLLSIISPGMSLSDLIFVGQQADFMTELDRLDDAVDARLYLEERLVGSTIAVTSGLSLGYVIWLTRGGLLLASLLSSMPAWRLVDPVPILARLRDDDEEAEDDEESLDSMVGGGASRDGPDPDHDSDQRGTA